ncbi:MAG: hypothetical protein GY801_06355 [bacterium]|nr:hypothetical protein [bacterium]
MRIFQRAVALDPALEIDPQTEALKPTLLEQGMELMEQGAIQEALAIFAQVQPFDVTLEISAE